MKTNKYETLEGEWSRVVNWFALALFWVVAIILWAPKVFAYPPQIIYCPPGYLVLDTDAQGFTTAQVDTTHYGRVADGTYFNFTTFKLVPDTIFKNGFGATP